MNSSRLEYLFHQYLDGTASPEETDELMDLLERSDRDAEIKTLLEKSWNEFDSSENVFSEDQLNAMRHFILEKTKPAPVRRIFPIRRIAVAASIILMLGVGVFLLLNRSAKQNDIVSVPLPISHDVKAPQLNRATITMTNGEVVYLDSVANGKLFQQNGVDLVKLSDGKISYNGNTTELIYNTLNNPRGSKSIDMLLADGSHVWLNAGSSITYPMAFVGDERKVSVVGEAYFEVAKNEKQPFKVMLADSSTVTVLGTHFNVMSYPDENKKEITLLEGSVTVSNKNANRKLEPGMQAVIQDENILTRRGIDTEEIMGWKNGYFVFHDAPIESIMLQIERWYDAKVIYQGQIKELFNASIQRSEPLSKLLHLLELNGYVHFKTKDKTIYVLP